MLFAAALLLLSCATVSLPKAQSVAKFRLTVRIANFDNSSPLASAAVNLLNVTTGNPLSGATRVVNTTGYAEWSGTQGIEPGIYTLTVDRRGVEVLRKNITVSNDQTMQFLVGAGNLAVNFLTTLGEPVEDVTATLVRAEFSETQTSDDSGRVTFTNEPFGDYTLNVHRQDVNLGSVLINLTNSTAGLARDFSIPLYNLTVDLRAFDGTPLPEEAHAWAYDWGTGTATDITATSSVNRFKLTAPPGKYWLIAQLNGQEILESLLTHDKNGTMALNTDYGYSLLIKVVDGSKMPVAGANVEVYVDGEFLTQSETGQNGEIELQNLRRGQYRIEAYYGGDLRGVDTLSITNPTSVELTLGNLSGFGGLNIDAQILSVVTPLVAVIVAVVVTYLAWRLNRQPHTQS